MVSRGLRIGAREPDPRPQHAREDAEGRQLPCDAALPACCLPLQVSTTATISPPQVLATGTEAPHPANAPNFGRAEREDHPLAGSRTHKEYTSADSVVSQEFQRLPNSCVARMVVLRMRITSAVFVFDESTPGTLRRVANTMGSAPAATIPHPQPPTSLHQHLTGHPPISPFP
ncbi:hypothetical protein K525DRAFT_275544 [Schizophyllum commune Loenen D]|nr:hypothetical protein K525DRAFT_275544 [Schizophyllum commune Loenen D]